MNDFVGIKHHGHVVIHNFNLFYSPVVMLSIACFAGRGMPSLTAMLLMYMYMYTI